MALYMIGLDSGRRPIMSAARRFTQLTVPMHRIKPQNTPDAVSRFTLFTRKLAMEGETHKTGNRDNIARQSAKLKLVSGDLP